MSLFDDAIRVIALSIPIRFKISSPTTSASLPHKREDWPHQFEEEHNAGDLDEVIALYEPEAQFVTRTAEALVGRDAIRKVLTALVEAKTQFRRRVVRAIIVGEIAKLYSDFEGTTVDDSGKTVPVHAKAIEVLLRQPDGS